MTDWSWLAWVGGAFLAIVGGICAEFYRGLTQVRGEIARLVRTLEYLRHEMGSVLGDLVTEEYDRTSASIVLAAVLDILRPAHTRARTPVPLKLSDELDREVAHTEVELGLAISLFEDRLAGLERIETALRTIRHEDRHEAEIRVQELREEALASVRDNLNRLTQALDRRLRMVKQEIESLPPWYQLGEP